MAPDSRWFHILNSILTPSCVWLPAALFAVAAACCVRPIREKRAFPRGYALPFIAPMFAPISLLCLGSAMMRVTEEAPPRWPPFAVLAIVFLSVCAGAWIFVRVRGWRAVFAGVFALQLWFVLATGWFALIAVTGGSFHWFR